MLKVVSKHYDLPDPWDFRPPEGIQLLDVRTLEDLAEHADAWNRLLQQADRQSPILSYAWMHGFFKNLVKPPESWLCLFIYENKQLTGVLPLVSSYAYQIPGFSLRLFKLPYHIAHTGGTDCLTLPGREDILDLFLSYLNRLPRTLPVLSFKHVPEHYPSIQYFARKRHKMCAAKIPAGAEGYLPLPKNEALFLAGLSGKFRQNLRRATRELEKIPDLRFRFFETSRPAKENARRFLEVEPLNWKGARGTAVIQFPGSAETFTEAAEELAAQHRMAFSFLESGDRTIAAQYAMINGRILYILKMAYDEAFEPCSPGNLLMFNVINQAIASGRFDEINLISDAPLLTRWNVQYRPLIHLIVLPKIPILSRLLIRVIESQKFHPFDPSR
jgi:hypothetical protein